MIRQGLLGLQASVGLNKARLAKVTRLATRLPSDPSRLHLQRPSTLPLRVPECAHLVQAAGGLDLGLECGPQRLHHLKRHVHQVLWLAKGEWRQSSWRWYLYIFRSEGRGLSALQTPAAYPGRPTSCLHSPGGKSAS